MRKFGNSFAVLAAMALALFSGGAVGVSSAADPNLSPALQRIAEGKTGSADLGDFGLGDLVLRPSADPIEMTFRLPRGSSQGKHARWYLTTTWAEVRLTGTSERREAEIGVDGNDIPVSRFVVKSTGEPSDRCGGKSRILLATIDYVDGERHNYTCKRRFFVRFSNYLADTNQFLGVGVRGGRNKLSYFVRGANSFVRSVRILKRSLLIVRDKGWPNLTMSNFHLTKDPIAGEPFRVSYAVKRSNPRTSVPARGVVTRADLDPFGQDGLHILSKPVRIGTLAGPRRVSARLVADSAGEYTFYLFAGGNTNSPGAKLKVIVGEP